MAYVNEPTSLYVHIPFCVRKCPYCGFFSVAGCHDLVPAYLNALRAELAAAPRVQPMQTIYVGGGTPTSLPAEQLRALLAMINGLVQKAPGCEFTIEANPGTVDAEKAAVLRDGGVNRVSLGAQSFQPRILKKLGRIHGTDEIHRAVEIFRQAGFTNIGLDLIFAIPGQILADWQDSLNAAIALNVPHVSTYGLSFDEGTQFEQRLSARRMHKFSESGYLRMYDLARHRLREAGFTHYEISNFARPGLESRHNCNYWLNGGYLGVGASATGFVGGMRRTNVADVEEYMRRIKSAGSAATFSEQLAPEHFARETAAFNIRYLPGIERESFRERTGYDIEELFGGLIAQYSPEFLIYENGVLRLTEQAVACADSISAEFLRKE